MLHSEVIAVCYNSIMTLTLGLVVLFFLYIIWKLFVDGWLFKIILFFGGWFGLYMALRMYVQGSMNTALTLGTDHPIALSWAAVIPTIVCFLCLLYTKVSNE
jgi:uncharacterized membrane protein